MFLVAPAPAAELVFHGSGPAEHQPVDVVSRQSGFVAVPAGVGLVSSAPYMADGTLSQADLLNRRIRISLGETEAPDGADAGAAANPFAALGRRRTGNLSADLWRDGADVLTFSSTVAESRRMLIDGRSGMPRGEEHNRVFGSGLAFATGGNRLRGLAELAWSRRTGPETRAGDAIRRSERADLAWRARLEADLLKGDRHALGVWVSKRRVAPGYAAVAADAPANRDELALGGHGRVGIVTLDLSFVEFTDNLDRRQDTLTTRDRTVSATLGFDLRDHGPAPLLPSALRLTATIGSLAGLPAQSDGTFSDAITDRHRSGFGIAADWPLPLWGGDGTLTLGARRFEVDNREPGLDTADTREDSVSLAYTTARPLWTGSLTATAAEIANAEEGNRSHTRRYSLAGHAATTHRAGRRLSLTMNISHARTDLLDAGGSDTDTAWGITAGGELNGLLGADPVAEAVPIVGYVRMSGDNGGSDAARGSLEVTAGIRARLVF